MNFKTDEMTIEKKIGKLETKNRNCNLKKLITLLILENFYVFS